MPKIQISYDSEEQGTAFVVQGGRVIPIGGITSGNIAYTHKGKWSSAQETREQAETKLIKILE
ncbi:hypothetical protein K9L16_02445 [Candidatus Pacearchaeota archaeon]|nr:hypothetical protein [Candidatus Pacearchaeota archaeon]